MVFYRKYRPQTLADLIGQEHIKQTLQSAFKNQKLSHAYLFCGPRGTGKTSTARILAKIVNCERQVMSNQSEGEQKSGLLTQDLSDYPCNKCDTCLSITDGSNLDLIEIDAASNRGIDDIRSLRETIKLAPSGGFKKVYIIDEVHMLSTEAFNALLKTLEEPPAHVLFILATTDPHKIPDTILSRVQKLNFQLAKQADLVAALSKVVKAEKLDIETDALELIASKSEGSFRDCLKNLDLLASLNKKITIEDVNNCLKSADFNLSLDLIELIKSRNIKSGLELVGSIVSSGVNIKDFILSTLEIMRGMLLYKHGVSSLNEEIGSEKFAKVAEIAQNLEIKKIVEIIERMQVALEKMRTASIISLPLEVCIVNLCQENLENQNSNQVAQSSKSSLKVEPIILEKSQNLVDANIQESQVVQEASADLAKIIDKWTYILETIKPYNYSLEALLRQVKLQSCEDGIVILEVPYSFHQRILEAPKSRDLLESVLSDVLGKQSRIKTEIGKRPVNIEELANVELAADDDIIKVAAEIFNSDTN